MSELFLGLDLGQAHDPTALTVIDRVTTEHVVQEPHEVISKLTGQVKTVHMHERTIKRTHYEVRHLKRFALHTTYPAIVESIYDMFQLPELKRARLVVDGTGVGRPVLDLLRIAPLNPIGIFITGGDQATYDNGCYSVPKRDLISVVQVLLQSQRLKFAEGLPEVQTLIKELLNFQMKINLKTAHDSYGAWREGTHDDLLLAVALALWFAERGASGWVRGPAK